MFGRPSSSTYGCAIDGRVPKTDQIVCGGLRATSRGDNRSRVAAEELPFEYMLNVLRLTDEFDEVDFVARTGLPFATIARGVGAAQRKGLLEQAGSTGWRVTELGQRFLNDLQALFLPERADEGQSDRTTGA